VTRLSRTQACEVLSAVAHPPDDTLFDSSVSFAQRRRARYYYSCGGRWINHTRAGVDLASVDPTRCASFHLREASSSDHPMVTKTDFRDPPDTMTGDEFRSKYKVVKRLTEEGVRSFHATDSSGTDVMIHLLRGGPVVDRLRFLLDRLDPSDEKWVREVAFVETWLVVVSEPLQEFTSLESWLEVHSREREATAPRAGARTSAHPSGDVSQPQATASPPGEFTLLFRPGGSERDTSQAEKSPAQQEDRVEEPGTPPGAASPAPADAGSGPAPELPPPPLGELTRLFQQQAESLREDPEEGGGRRSEERSAAGETQAAASFTEPGQPRREAPRGEFTDLFGRLAESPDASAEAPADSAGAGQPSEPSRGDFTDLFGAPGRSPGIPPPRRPDTGEGPPPAESEPAKRKPVVRWRQDKRSEIPPSRQTVEPPSPSGGAPRASSSFVDLFGPSLGASELPGKDTPPSVDRGPFGPMGEPSLVPPAAEPLESAPPLGGESQNYLERLSSDAPPASEASGPSPTVAAPPFAPLVPPPLVTPPVAARPLSSGPSEYTRVIAQSPSEPLPELDAGGARAKEDTPPVQPTRSKLPIFLFGLALLLIAMTTLVLIIIL